MITSVPTIVEVILLKSLRFGAGLIFTILGAILGRYCGLQLSKNSPQNELRNNITLALKWIVFFIPAGTVIYLVVKYIGEKYVLFHWIAGLSHQLLLVLIRTLLVMAFSYYATLAGGFTKVKLSSLITTILILILSALEIVTLLPSALLIETQLVDSNGIIRQSTGVTCAPCCLANVSRLYGLNLSERDAALIMRNGIYGTFPNEIAAAARAVGFTQATPWRATLAEIASDDLPLILLVKLFDEWDRHVVVLVGMSSTTLTIVDSLKGLVTRPIEGFEKEWRGNCVRLGIPKFASSTTTIRLSNFDPDLFQRFSPLKKSIITQ